MSKGYGGTSMNEVAQKAGVSKLTIYSHFSDKDQLFKAVIEQRCDEHIMPSSFLSLASRTPEEALIHIAQGYIHVIFSECSVELHRLMQAEGARYPHIVQLFYEAGPQRVRRAFAELLEQWCKQGQLTISDIPKASEQFFSLLKGEIHMKRLLGIGSLPDTEQIDRHIQASVQLFLAAYHTH